MTPEELAHRMFAPVDCFAYTGEGQPVHSQNCKDAERAIREIFANTRNEALEEAAKVVEDQWQQPKALAAAIRGLKCQ